MRAFPVLLAALLAAPAASAQVFELDLLWYRFADPGGGVYQGQDGYETDRGIVNGESAEFSPDGQLIVTTSKADGRIGDYPTESLTGGTSHLRLWDLQGNLLWDRPRSPGPDANGDGRPDDQPGDRTDEIEIAVFSPDGNYVAAAGEDDLVEVWQVKDLQTGAVLSAPVLVRTLTEAGAAYDALRFSNSGELLFGGTEERGKIEIWRTTGPPQDWVHVGEAVHGGSRIGQAVNSLDTSLDDRYLVSAGTDTNGGFWRINTTRSEATGEITAVSLDRLATMTQPLRSAKAARFESGTDRHVVLASKDQRMFVYDPERLKLGDAAPVAVLHNSLYNGVDGTVGVEIEPGAYSTDGRFLLNGGGPEHNFAPNAAGYRSSFFRVFETAEIRPGAPEPDPVHVQPAFHTEHFHFRPGDDRLTTAHEDGTVRLWAVRAGGAVTVASEGFNERSETHDRWTLSGPLSTATGDNEWGITAEPAAPEIGEPSVITQDARWVGHRGSRYLGADNLQGQLHRLTLNEAWDAAGFSDLQVQFAVAAARGAFEGNDLLRLEADLDGDGAFETTVAEFLPDGAGDLAFGGRKATPIFEDHFVDLSPLLPTGWDGRARFRVEARTDSGAEELAFDGLRLIGVPDGGPGTGGVPGATYPAEDAAVGGGSDVRTNHAGYRGTGYANFPDAGGTVTFSVDGGAGGPATLAFRYANGEAPRTVELRVNGDDRLVTFASTGSWSGWGTASFAAALAPGLNAVRVRSVGEDGPNLDELAVAAAGAGQRAMPATEGSLALDAFPNPVRSRATVTFALTQAGPVQVAAYDVLGRRVALLAEGAFEAGRHAVGFDAAALPAGLYLLRLTTGDGALTRHLTVAR
jgi:WD40 repeat protein